MESSGDLRGCNAGICRFFNAVSDMNSGKRSKKHQAMRLDVLFLNSSSDQPAPPASQPVISQLSTESVVLSWTGPSYDGGTAVLGYKVEVRQEGRDDPESWTEAASRCKNTTYHVRSGLAPLGRYRFRVRAYNSAGVSEPSQESECVEMVTKSKGCVFYLKNV